MKGVKDLTNQVYGRLTALRYAGDYRWHCRCVCGKGITVFTRSLTGGTTRSCGCLLRDRAPSVITHGETRGRVVTSEYRAFYHARQRCQNPRAKSYHRYGGRGIQFCFTTFQDFLECVGRRPSTQHSLDRIDNDGNYESGNVRWATPIEQRANQTAPPQLCCKCGKPTQRMYLATFCSPCLQAHKRVQAVGYYHRNKQQDSQYENKRVEQRPAKTEVAVS